MDRSEGSAHERERAAQRVSASMSLRDGLAALAEDGVSLPESAPEQLARYLELLDKWNRVYNLTAIRDAERMVTHHVLDALAVLPHLPQTPTLRLLDVGSGAGVPGIPLALARPQWRVTLLDSNHKKGAFMQQALAELGTSNAEVRICRIEDFSPAQPFDVVISRAFSDLATFADAAARVVARDGRLVAMKGVFPHEELREVPQTMRVVDTRAIAVPGVSAERHLVMLEPA